MRLHEYILAALIISFVIVSGTLIIANVGDEYGVDTSSTTDKFGAVYDRINETYGIAEDINNDVLNSSIDGAAPWESMIIGSYAAVKLTKNSFELLGDMLSAVAKEMGVPAFVLQFAITALMIMILFAIIYLVMKIRG